MSARLARLARQLIDRLRDATPAAIVFALGAIVLAIEPLLWLVGTWTEPAYDSPGGWIFVAALGLFAWSATSAHTGAEASTRHAWWLLLATALIRLAGQMLAINVLGALALAIDVYALGVLCGLKYRKRAISPFWLSVLFAFSLPVERIFQRLVGYGLQHMSAAGSCSLLGLAFDDVACAGVEITLAGQQVLVDLPCSGARGLVLLSVLFSALAALVRPTLRQAAGGVVLALVSAIVANSIRIAALAVGIAFSDSLVFGAMGGIDVMAQPWHDLVGLAALAIGVAPLVAWARHINSPPHSKRSAEKGRSKVGHINSPPHSKRSAEKGRIEVGTDVVDRPNAPANPTNGPHLDPPHAEKRAGRDSLTDHVGRSATLGTLFLLAALAILFAPQKPVDVARPIDSIELPSNIGGHPASPRELSELERDYFTRFGGAAARASYGPHTLLLVRTSAPIRHLHAPDECLGGAGFDVELRGVSGQALPGATYLAGAPDGSRWRVVVTYVSDRGEVATSISEVVWRWLKDTDTTWTAVERFHPADAPYWEAEAFDAAVARAFDIPPHPERKRREGEDAPP
ncbi:MAG: exosortase T [Persicimonas sp.]